MIDALEIPGFPVLEVIEQHAYVRLERLDHGVLRLVLARPELRNAFDPAMVLQITELLHRAETCASRLLLLDGEGDVFCAGADLVAMAEVAEGPADSNLADARALARMFRTLAAFPIPVLAVVRGVALGGGTGLAVCADGVVAQECACFGTPEVRLGLVPATIGPYVLRRLGLAHGTPLLLSGRRITAQSAAAMGLVSRLVSDASPFPEAVAEEVRAWCAAGPEAARRTKQLLLSLKPLPTPQDADHYAQVLAEARVALEGRQGFTAFRAKQPTPWQEDGVW